MRDRSICSSLVRHILSLALVAASLLGDEGTAFAQQGNSGNAVARQLSLTGEAPRHEAIGRQAGWLAYAHDLDPQTIMKPGSSWFARHPVMTGTLIGTGAGLALSQVDSIGGVNHDPRVALIGAAAGAWGGLIASASQKARAGRKVGVGTKIGIAVGAASLVLLPFAACYGAGGCGGSS